MKKTSASIAMSLIANLVFSQMGITKNSSITIHDKAILQIDGKYQGKNYGIMLPAVSSYNNLPLATSVDATMTGMVNFESTHATFYSYDGTKWNNEIATTNLKANQSRFLSSASDKTSVVCVLLGCGRHVGLSFNAPVDGQNLITI